MYLLISQSTWLVAALLLGFGMGWIAVVQHGEGLSKPKARWAAGVVAVLALVALARLLPGRAGYWLDLGLVMLGVYLLGCAAGSMLRDRVLAQHGSQR